MGNDQLQSTGGAITSSSRPRSSSTQAARPPGMSNTHAIAGPSNPAEPEVAIKKKQKKKKKVARELSFESDGPIEDPDDGDLNAEVFVVGEFLHPCLIILCSTLIILNPPLITVSFLADAIVYAIYKPFSPEKGIPGCGWHYHNLWHNYPLAQTAHEEPITHDMFDENTTFVKEFWQHARSSFEKENKLIARASTQRKGKHPSEPPAKVGDVVYTPANLFHKWYREALGVYKDDWREAKRKLAVKPSSAKWLARKKNAIKWIRWTNMKIAESLRDSAGYPLLPIRKDDESSAEEESGTSGSSSEEEPSSSKQKKNQHGKVATSFARVAGSTSAATATRSEDPSKKKKRPREDSPEITAEDKERRRRKRLKRDQEREREREGQNKNPGKVDGASKGKGKESAANTATPTSPDLRPRAWSPGLYAGGSPESRKREEKRAIIEKLARKRERAERKRLERQAAGLPPLPETATPSTLDSTSATISNLTEATTSNPTSETTSNPISANVGPSGSRGRRVVVISDSDDELSLVQPRKVPVRTAPKITDQDSITRPVLSTVLDLAPTKEKIRARPMVAPLVTSTSVGSGTGSGLSTTSSAMPTVPLTGSVASEPASAKSWAPLPTRAEATITPPQPKRREQPLFLTEDAVDDQTPQEAQTGTNQTTAVGANTKLAPIWAREAASQSPGSVVPPASTSTTTSTSAVAPASASLPALIPASAPPTAIAPVSVAAAAPPAKQVVNPEPRLGLAAKPMAASSSMPVAAPPPRRAADTGPNAGPSVAAVNREASAASRPPVPASFAASAASDPRRSTAVRTASRPVNRLSTFEVPCQVDIRLPGMSMRTNLFISNLTVQPAVPFANANDLFYNVRPTKQLVISRFMSLDVIHNVLTKRALLAHAKIDVADGPQLGHGNRVLGQLLRELGNPNLREGLASATVQPNIIAILYSTGSDFARMIRTPAHLVEQNHGLLAAFIGFAPGMSATSTNEVLGAFDVMRKAVRADDIHPDTILGSLGFTTPFFNTLRGTKVAVVADMFRPAIDGGLKGAGANVVQADQSPSVVILDQAGLSLVQHRRGTRSLAENGCEFWLCGPTVPARSPVDSWLPTRVLEPQGGIVLLEPSWVLVNPDLAHTLAERIHQTPGWSAYITLQTVFLLGRIKDWDSKSDWDLKLAATETLPLLHLVDVRFPLALSDQKLQRLEGMQEWAKTTTLVEKIAVANRYSHIGYDAAVAKELAEWFAPSQTEVLRLDHLAEQDLERRRNLPLTTEFKRLVALGTDLSSRASGLPVMDVSGLEALL